MTSDDSKVTAVSVVQKIKKQGYHLHQPIIKTVPPHVENPFFISKKEEKNNGQIMFQTESTPMHRLVWLFLFRTKMTIYLLLTDLLYLNTVADSSGVPLDLSQKKMSAALMTFDF